MRGALAGKLLLILFFKKDPSRDRSLQSLEFNLYAQTLEDFEISDEQLMAQSEREVRKLWFPFFRRYGHAVRSVACRILRN